MITLFGAITGWLHFGALVLALGAVLARWSLVPRTARDAPGARDALRRAADRLAFVAALLLPAAMALVFARQLLEFRDPFVPWTEDARLLLSGTAWGATWSYAAGASLLALAAGVMLRAGPMGWGGMTIATLALSAYPALSGHASGTEELRSVTVVADIVHVVAAGFWIGGLAFVLEAERRVRAGVGAGDATVLPVLVPIFSRFALASVAVLALSGTLAAWVHLDGLDALVSTTYGRLLALKLGLVAVVLGLGAINWRRLTPQLGSETGRAALRRSATFELVAGQIVLLVTAVLVRTPPMGS